MTKSVDDTPAVEAYLAALDHPLKEAMVAVRSAILQATPGIHESIKWNAPSFYYKGDMVVFNPRATEYVHLVWPNGIVIDTGDGLLEGEYPDRRMTYLYSLEDVIAKQSMLQDAVQRWVAYMDEHGLDT